MTLTRRHLLTTGAALAAAGSLPGRPASAQALQPVTIATPFGFIIDFLELMNAKSGGHFQAAGLDATIVGAGGAVGSMQQLAGGRAQFTRNAGIDVLKAVAVRNLPVVSIATLFQGSTFVVASASAKPIQTPADMKGKTIGVVSVGGSTENLLDLMLAKSGVPKEEVKREQVGNNPAAFAFIQQGRIDGFICSSNVASLLKRQGSPVTIWSTDLYAPMPSQCYVTTQEVIDTKPDLCLAFTRALKASVDEILKGPIEPIILRAQKEFDIPGAKDVAALVQTIEEDIPLWMTQGPENLLRNVPALWKSGRDALAEAKMGDIPDEKKVYTNRFIDAVIKG